MVASNHKREYRCGFLPRIIGRKVSQSLVFFWHSQAGKVGLAAKCLRSVSASRAYLDIPTQEDEVYFLTRFVLILQYILVDGIQLTMRTPFYGNLPVNAAHTHLHGHWVWSPVHAHEWAD